MAVVVPYTLLFCNCLGNLFFLALNLGKGGGGFPSPGMRSLHPLFTAWLMGGDSC